jgi:hypothetical protein
MKLKKISAVAIKGRTFTLDLDDRTLLHGDNFVGKSARADAIRLALLGYLPELGKTPRATFGLCSGREMSVEAWFDDGSRIFRRWYLKGDAVKTEELLPPAFDGNAELVAVMMSAEVYFGKTENERVNYIFANVPGLAAEHSADAIRANFAQSLYEVEGLDSAAIDAVLARLDEARRAVESTPAFAGWTPQLFVDCLADFVAEEAKTTKQSVAVFEKTVQGLSHLRTTAAESAAAADIAALDAEHKTLTNELTALREEQARVRATQEQARASKRRRDEISRELAVRPSQLAQRETRLNRIKAIEAELAALPEIPAAEVRALEEELRTLELSHRDFTRQTSDAANAINANERELAGLNLKTVCPYCGAAGEGWKKIKAAEITSTLDGLKAKRTQLGAAADTALKAIGGLRAKVDRQLANSHARRTKEQALAAERSAFEFVERTLAVLDEKQKQLDALPAATPDAAVDTATEKAGKVSVRLAEIESVRRTHDGRKHELQRLAQSEEKRDEAAKGELVAKAAVKIVRELKAQLVEAAVKPILAIANGIFPDVLRHPLAYHDGEIGWWLDGAWVGHKTFSGTEKALAYAAIQTALSSRAPFRFMLLDELGVIRDANAQAFVDDVGRAIENGVLDQFVGVDIADRYGRANGLSVVEIEDEPV